MPNTYTEIARINGDGSATTITFSSIPSTYTDLVLVANIFTTANANQVLRVNGDSGSNYSTTVLYGNGTSALSTRSSNNNAMTFQTDLFATSTIPATTVFNFMNYANTNTFKTVISRSNKANQSTETHVNLWRNTAAITSITISGATFTSDATFSLYGIANADQGAAKATGGIITEDAQYYYHTFVASGTFTPKQSLTCDYLVVAGGGGGGGYNAGGGGGAGGLRSTVGATGGGGSLETALSLSATGYTVTIGAGGAGASNTGIAGTAGSNSVFSTITSTGGGGGSSGGALDIPGSSGGSGGGGGGGGPSGVTNSGSAGTTNQGYAGGTGQYSTFRSAGGGGGAGAVGTNGNGGSVNGAGAGGIGVQITSIATTTGTGSSNYYAGGGAGGADGSSTARTAGGTGGGGTGGGNGLAATAGTANTGSGGGGGGGNVNGSAAGGSGIVIVRYAK